MTMSLVTFSVSVPVCRSLSVFVTGNCTELGEWSPNAAVPLSLQTTSDAGDIWSTKVHINAPRVEYRYFLGCLLSESVDPKSTDCVITVQSWESGKFPRSVELNGEAVDSGEAVFGICDGPVMRINRGWLTGQSEICLRLHAKSIRLMDASLAEQHYRIKCSAVDLRPMTVDSNISATFDGHLLVSPVFVSMFGSVGSQLQSEDGTAFDSNSDHLTFRVQTCNVDNVAFKITLCLDEENVGFTKLPEIGVAYWHPGNVSRADVVTLPIICEKQDIIGMMMIDALVINSIKNCPKELNFCPRQWQAPTRSLNIGHRGMGSSYINGVPNARVRENTLLSFYEAAKHGADMVEFDVMLTRDEVPVVFHDFMACMKVLAADGKQTYNLKVPVSDLTVAELGSFNVSKCQDSIVNAMINDDEQMFPTLRRCFEAVDPKIGFNIEVKYCMHLRSTGQYEEGVQHFAERNCYIDVILRDIFQHAGSRPIVLSCFDPDICMMMCAKQTCYPVVFLSQGETLKYATFQDPRSATLSLAVSFAISESLMGVALHTEDLLKDLALIARAHSSGLAVFSWGEDNNNAHNLELQRKHLMDGMIYDRLDEFKGISDEE